MMSPLRWLIYRSLTQNSEPVKESKKSPEEPKQIEVMVDDAPSKEELADRPAEKKDQERKAGVFEWAWFTAWGLLIPMLFYLFYGFIGLIVGLFLFGIYMMIVYISIRPEEERKGLEEKADRFQRFVDARAESLSQKNRALIFAIRQSVIRNLPGFRTQTPWRMFFASIFYLSSFMIMILAFYEGRFGLALVLAVIGVLFVSGTQDETL